MYILLVLLASLCLYQSPPIAQLDNPQPQQNGGHSQNDTNQGTSTSKGEVTENAKQAQTENHEDIPEKRLYHRYLRATIIGVCVSLLVLVGLIVQTALTIKAVKASERSADALVASERAWVMVDVEPAPGYSGPFEGDLTMGEVTTGTITKPLIPKFKQYSLE